MLGYKTKTNSGTGFIVQPKLKIGQPGDKYEQEADIMADRVMSMPQNGNTFQRECVSCEEDELQMTPLPGDTLQMQPGGEAVEMGQPNPAREESVTEIESSEEEDGGMTWSEMGEAIVDTLMRHPPTLSQNCTDRANEIQQFLEEYPEGSRYYYTVQTIFSGFFNLAFELTATEGETTVEQRSRYTELLTSWEEVKQNIEDYIAYELQRNLRKTRKQIEVMKQELVLVYRRIYLSGEDSTLEIVINETSEETSALRDITDQVTSLLSEINTADAAIAGRQVAPAMTALSRAFQFMNVILGWNFTGELDSASQEAFDDLQNGFALLMTAASFTAAAAYLPLFGHIPILLGEISKLYDKLVEAIREHNTVMWEELGMKGVCSEEPGGCETLDYMISVFEAGSWENVTVPPEGVAGFFVSRREMFNAVGTEVMETGEVPTESSWLLFTEIDEESFTPWVYFNREWIWRLIYGDRENPDERE